jgi:hypothetical protein
MTRFHFSKSFHEQIRLHAQVRILPLQTTVSSSKAFICLIRDASTPPHFDRHFKNDALLKPCTRHSSATSTTPSAHHRIAMI